MDWALALSVMIGLILALMGVGVPVAFAFFATNIVCLYLYMGGPVGVTQMVTNFGDAVSIYALTPMPLFLIMGSLFFRSGLGDGVFRAIDLCIGNLRARLSYLVVLAGAVFASLSGSSLANTGMMGTAMVPEMLRRGYRPHMVYGPVLRARACARRRARFSPTWCRWGSSYFSSSAPSSSASPRPPNRPRSAAWA